MSAGPQPILTIEEADGDASVSGVNTIKVSNGTLTDEGGGVVSIDTSSPPPAEGITSINGDTAQEQVIAAGLGMSVIDSSGVHSLAVTGEALLATVTGINLDSATAQDVYTVPTGKTLIPTRTIFSNPTANDFATGSIINLRVIDSTAATQIGTQPVAGSAPSASAVITVTMGNANLLIAAGNKVQVKPDVAYGDDNTCTVRTFGILF